MTRVVVHIGRLVLRGVDPAARGVYADALCRELARLLAAPGALDRVTRLDGAPRLYAGSLRATDGGFDRRLAAAAARRIGAALSASDAGPAPAVRP